MRIGTIRELWRYPAKSMQGERVEQCVIGARGVVGDRGWALRDEGVGELTTAKRLPALMQWVARYRDEPTAEHVPGLDITLPDGTRIASDAPDVNEKLSAALGRPVTLWPLQPASDRAHYRRAQPGAAVIGWLSRSPAVVRVLQGAMERFGLAGDLRAIFGRLPDEPLPDLSALPGELLEFTSPPGTYFDAFPLHVLTTATLATMRQAAPTASWDVRRFRPNLVIETAPEIAGQPEATWSGKTLRIGAARLRCEVSTPRCSMTMQPQADLPKDPLVLRTIVREGGQALGTYATAQAAGRVAVGDAVDLE